MHFSHDLVAGILIPLLPLIRAGLGLNYLQSGLLISARAITTGLSQLPGGWLGDRFSKRVVIAIGIGGVGLASLAIGLSSAYYPLLVILALGVFLSVLIIPQQHQCSLTILKSREGERY